MRLVMTAFRLFFLILINGVHDDHDLVTSPATCQMRCTGFPIVANHVLDCCSHVMVRAGLALCLFARVHSDGFN